MLGFGLLAIVSGATFLDSDMLQYTGFGLLVLSIIGMFITSYQLILKTSSGDQQVYSSRSKERAIKIKDAIE